MPETVLGNPNDLAFTLLLGAAFILILVFQRSWILRILWVGAFSLTLLYVLKSGSRASFVTLLGVVVVAWLLASRGVKLVFVLLAPVLMVWMVMLVPRNTWNRLSFIVKDPAHVLAMTDDPVVRAAVGSQLARTELQKQAWRMTLAHPLLGVGPQQFEDVNDAMVREQTGRKSGWQVTHNVYLQISSECGIPALLLYVWVIILCWRLNYQSYKLCGSAPDRRSMRAQSYCLLLASFVYAIGIAFCNVAYYAYLPILVGFTAANAMAVKREVQETA